MASDAHTVLLHCHWERRLVILKSGRNNVAETPLQYASAVRVITTPPCVYFIQSRGVKETPVACGSNVNLTGVNSNAIMSGCVDDNPDDARREAARDNSKSV